MTNELCFCFWYYLSGQRKLVGLSARGYYLSGDDDQKGQLLSRLASTDHLTQNISHVPPRLLRLFPDGVPYETVMEFGIEEVFAEMMSNPVLNLAPFGNWMLREKGEQNVSKNLSLYELENCRFLNPPR